MFECVILNIHSNKKHHTQSANSSRACMVFLFKTLTQRYIFIRRYAMEHKTYKSYDELPLMLSVQDVADVLGISMSGAYELVKEQGFPHLRIGAAPGSWCRRKSSSSGWRITHDKVCNDAAGTISRSSPCAKFLSYAERDL